MNRLLIVAAVLVTSFACTTEGEPRGTDRAQAIPAPTEATSSTSTKCDYGPWARYCPEADWARLALKNAGYRLTGNTGSALEARHDGLTFHFWAFTPEARQEKQLGRALADENYREIKRSVAGITVYTDGSRFAWSVDGLWTWLTSAGFVDGTPGATSREIRDRILEDLVAATKRTAFISPD